MRARTLQIGAAIATAAGVALGGCGDDQPGGELASLVPPDVPIYAEAVIRPEGEQRNAIESLAERVAGAADRLGDDFPLSLFLDIQQGFALAEQGADVGSPDYQAAQPYVEQLGSVVAGARIEDGLLVSRLIVSLAQ